eukprot:1144286-Pelagomonas_calceolata.AAC.1
MQAQQHGGDQQQQQQQQPAEGPNQAGEAETAVATEASADPMDAELKEEQIGTTFVLIGVLEGVFWGGWVPQGGPAQNLHMPSTEMWTRRPLGLDSKGKGGQAHPHAEAPGLP